MILASTVDRNLVSADAIREKLNDLVNDVRMALLDPQLLTAYMQDTSMTEIDSEWTKCLDDEDLFGGDFFEGFAGQGRTHWHYGGTVQSLNLGTLAKTIFSGTSYTYRHRNSIHG